MGIKLSRLLQLALTPAVATSTILASPANAATLSFSQVSLSLNNFNQSSQDVSADADGSAIAISDGGLVTADVDFDTIFFADQSQVFANSDSEGRASGEGSRFFGQTQFLSELVGIFDVSAGQDFAFDFEVAFNLENTVDGLQSGSVSTRGSAGFSLFNSLNQELSFVDIFGALNTNLTNDQDNGFFLLPTGANIIVDDIAADFNEQNTPDGKQESAQFLLEGSFQQRFNQDTQLALVGFTTNESCVQAPRVNDACKIPEPSNIVALILVGSWLGVLSSVMKQVIQLAR